MTPRTTELAREALAAAAGIDNVRDAEQRDAVGGVRPRWVCSVSDTDHTAAAMRVAAEHELRVVPKGSGCKIDWGNAPESVDLLLDLAPATGIVEHAAGDLVVHAKAGTAIADVQKVVRAQGQQLAIDQPLPTATVGGVIATATSGPCRHLFGAVRDLLIGITVVRADGAVTISGGKVVKNVAGYDLGKLYTGSYGTLGVITEAIFRLHPLAAEHHWITVTVDELGAAGQAVDAIRHAQAMPTAIEVERPAPDGPVTVCAQLEGRPEATHARAVELAELVTAASGTSAEVLDHAPDWWGRYPFDPAAGIGLRLGVEPSALPKMLAGAQESARKYGVSLAIRGAAGLGVVHGGVLPETDPATVADLVSDLRKSTDHAVLLRAPHAAGDSWGPIPSGVLTLMRRTKDQFDPEHRLSPGRFVGGI